MTTDRYILVDGKPVQEPDLYKWASWIGNSKDRFIKSTIIGDTKISTVFLGLDHRYIGEGMPILFESMCFGGELDQEMERYTSLEDAKRGHSLMCQKVRSHLDNPK